MEHLLSNNLGQILATDGVVITIICYC